MYTYVREIPTDVQCDMCEVTYPHLHIVPMGEILYYESCDAGAWGGSIVLDTIEGKLKDSVQIESLRKCIMNEGFRMGYAPATEKACNYIHDGHHRIALLYDMGAKWCPVQLTARHGSDTQDYADEKIRRYNERWNRNYDKAL